jgi:hypothetical protein
VGTAYHIRRRSTCKNLRWQITFVANYLQVEKQIHSSISLQKLLLLVPTGQASTGGKAVPVHIDKSSERQHPRTDSFERIIFHPTRVSCGKIARTRTRGDDAIMWTQTCGASGLSPTTARTRPQTKIIECLVGPDIGSILPLDGSSSFIYCRANASAPSACTTSRKPRHRVILFCYEWRGHHRSVRSVPSSDMC